MSNVGKTARVSHAIPPDGTGTVVVELRGGVNSHPARAYEKTDQPIEKDARVWVVEEIGRTLYVSEG